MFRANIAQKAPARRRTQPVLLALLCLLSLILLSACASNTDSSTATVTPIATATPAVGDTSFIPVGTNPDIIVKSENAAQLTFVDSTAQGISSETLALPYKKAGNTVTIDFGEAMIQPLTIKIPREANLTVTMKNGNIAVDTIQGQVAISLANGTIKVKNFTPSGTNTIETMNGTIDMTFAAQASCNLKAQTDFGAIASGYAAISEKREAMQAKASGAIGAGSGVMVNLATRYGSITIGPA